MSGPQYNYGQGAGKYFIATVINRKDDPEQAGRVKIKPLEQEYLTEDQLHWARIEQPAAAGAIGGIMNQSPLGIMEQSTVLVYYADGAQQPIVRGVVGSAGKDDSGGGQLDQSGRNSALPWHSRDESHGGGDFRFQRDSASYSSGPVESGQPADPGKRGDKSIWKYAKDESNNPWQRQQSKDSEETGYTIGEDQYA